MGLVTLFYIILLFSGVKLNHNNLLFLLGTLALRPAIHAVRTKFPQRNGLTDKGSAARWRND